MFSCLFSTRYATGWEIEVDTLFLEKVLRAAYGDPAMGIQAGMVSAHALLSDTGLLNFLSACET